LRLYNTMDGICLNETRVYAKYGTIPEWNVSLITNMALAFLSRSEFNANISQWNTATVTNMVG
jgi:surface protein